MTLRVELASPFPPVRTRGAARTHLWREAPIHALMIVVMVVTMLSGSVALTVLGAVVLVATSIVCAAFCRARPFLREHVVDLWAMALVLLMFLPAQEVPSAPHSHLGSVPDAAMFTAVVVLWLIARVMLARGSHWRTSAVSGAVTAAGLIVMAVFCA